MTWESGTRAIIMLTRCVEKGREKCDRYWPFDTQPVYYGDIQVKTTHIFPEFPSGAQFNLFMFVLGNHPQRESLR